MQAKRVRGKSAATRSTSLEKMKPTAMTRSKPRAANRRIAASRSSLLAGSSSSMATPSSFCARSTPTYAASLKLLSPRPPTSKTRPTRTGLAAAPVTGAGGGCRGGNSVAAIAAATRSAVQTTGLVRLIRSLLVACRLRLARPGHVERVRRPAFGQNGDRAAESQLGGHDVGRAAQRRGPARIRERQPFEGARLPALQRRRAARYSELPRARRTGVRRQGGGHA